MQFFYICKKDEAVQLCYFCDPCYIHNSVITIAAKGMSTNYCYINHHNLLCI